ncbi:Cellulase (glycosyl hydrolase family 5 protein) [Ceratobasidium sp. AG-Ba]|nr:Cellulase (glycosyl hydrolase family 5 protein) [Ceratobasidium sp. AG-Ba]
MSSHPHEAETLLPPSALADPATARSSVVDSLAPPHSNYGGDVRESQYSSVPLNQSYGNDSPSPRTISPAQYHDDTTPGIGEKTDPVVSDYPEGGRGRGGKRPLWWILAGLLALAIIVVAVVVPVYFTVIKPNNHSSESNTGSGGAPPSPTQSGDPGTVPQEATTGGDGSKIVTETGTFIYNNSFGGFWVQDPKDPFNNNAQAQSWSPPLNTSWRWGVDKIRGVNLGGWLVLEPFITPALYEPYMNATIPAVDEWTLCTNLANDTSSGGVAKVLENHYNTFITEQDFAQIAGAGLNWVRIPIAFWAIDVFPGEPFLAGVSWKYFLKAIGWARKYGLRIKLDLHAIPGSQNGYNHSGKLGSINWLNGAMGISNAQRSLNYIRIFTEFISQPQYRDVIPLFGIVNEAVVATIGMDVVQSFYMEAHNMVRNITGYGQGNGPWLSVHDGFMGISQWADFMPGSDRVALDTHPYFCFTAQDTSSFASQNKKPCNWGQSINGSMSAYGMTFAGEFSNAHNDCGLFLNGVNRGARFDGTFNPYNGPTGGPNSCVQWMDAGRWDAATKAAIKQFALSSMDALQNFFFWTWKIGNSTTWGTVASPLWSYKLGLDNGFMPTDPREAIGACSNTSPWRGPLPASKTGGVGAGTIDSAFAAAHTWPPASLSGIPDIAVLPTYTPTASVTTLKPATFTGASVDAGSGWVNPNDQSPLYTAIAGCSYPNAWDAVDANPTACSAQRRFRGRAAMPRETGILL